MRKNLKRTRNTIPQISRYNRKTLHRDREYGFYWYAWLWKVLRPIAIFACSLIVVLGIIASGWSFVNNRFFAAVDVRDDAIVDFEIERGTTITAIGENLFKQDLLRNKGIFKYIIQFKGLTNRIQAGTYPLARSMDVNAIIDELTAGSTANERTITIIPGWTIEDITEYLVGQKALNASTRKQFLNLCNDLGTFEEDYYALQDAAQSSGVSERMLQLEGYLAPDTYRVYTNSTPESLIRTLLKQTDTVIDSVFNAEPIVEVLFDENGNIIQDTPEEPTADDADDDEPAAAPEFVYQSSLSRDETIVLASIIEKEAGKRADYAKVSAVFHNRLDRGMRLESDATVAYPLGVHRMILTTEELSSNTRYNTYLIDGLPVGPICSPSKSAIQAARYPDDDYIYDGYLYFCATDPASGELVFAKTREEHLANVAKYRPLWLAYDEKLQTPTK